MKNLFNKNFFLLGIILIIFVIIFIIIYFVKLNNIKDNSSLLLSNKVSDIQNNNNEDNNVNEELELFPIIIAKENQFYNYNIYFYGIKNVQLTYNGKNINLKDVLISNKIHMDDIISMANKDYENGMIKKFVAMDGGSTEYIYPNYTIIKLNKLYTSNEYNGENDVYIVRSGINISDINKLIDF